MSLIVDVLDAGADLPDLLDRATAGEEVVLSRAGQPCARLVPLGDAHQGGVPRRPGALRGRIDDTAFFDPLPDEELRAWDGDDLQNSQG